MSSDFEKPYHAKYLKYILLKGLPESASSLESNRLTLLFFSLSGLDIMGELSASIPREAIVNFIYSLQVVPDAEGKGFCGWRGSPFFGREFNASKTEEAHFSMDYSHIAMTYVALACLRILGDDLSRVNKEAVLQSMRRTQLKDGAFPCHTGECESDLRFVYCAASICTFLGDWSGMDKDAATKYITLCQNYDGGFGLKPGLESHGGGTFCAVASLDLMCALDSIPSKANLLKWCVSRMVGGFQGRVDKDPDSCYSFWVGSSIAIIGARDMIDRESTIPFVLSCQDMERGGFGKHPDSGSDPLHTYMSLSGLSVMRVPGLQEIDFSLNMSKRASPRGS